MISPPLSQIEEMHAASYRHYSIGIAKLLASGNILQHIFYHIGVVTELKNVEAMSCVPCEVGLKIIYSHSFENYCTLTALPVPMQVKGEHTNKAMQQ